MAGLVDLLVVCWCLWYHLVFGGCYSGCLVMVPKTGRNSMRVMVPLALMASIVYWYHIIAWVFMVMVPFGSLAVRSLWYH